jgi:hypothetical protein
MKLALSMLVTRAAAMSHEDITLSEWQQESSGKKVFLDMYAEW